MNRDKRKLPRRHFRYPAQVDMGDGVAMRPCTLSDVSQGGARMTIDAPDALPNEFALLLSSDGGARRWCQVAWRTETEIGVQFLPGPTKRRMSAQVAKLHV